MINSVVLDLMLGRLGKRTAPLIRTTCLQELNNAIRELERGPVKPWFLETTAENLATVANQDYVNIPDDFLMEVEDGTFEVQHPDEGWKELVKVTREKIRKETANEAAAFPEGYAIWGNRFLFGPTPDAVYSITFDYYLRTDVQVDNSQESTNSWINEFFDLTSYKALIIVARDHIQSDKMAANFTSAYNRAYDAFLREVEARAIAGRTLLLTDEES